jgi:hypothetical protein
LEETVGHHHPVSRMEGDPWGVRLGAKNQVLFGVAERESTGVDTVESTTGLIVYRKSLFEKSYLSSLISQLETGLQMSRDSEEADFCPQLHGVSHAC